VEAFLRIDCLDVGEAALVSALIRWGKFQLQKDGDDPNDGQKLRDKILPGLHLIRFAAVSHIEFAQLCLDGLEEVLSLEERYSIMKFIATKDWKQLPAQITPAKLAQRQTPHVAFHMKPNPLSHNGNGKSSCNQFTFLLDKNAMLVGLTVKGPHSSLKNLGISLAASKTIGGRRPILGFSQGKFSREGNEFFRVTPNIDLHANTSYTLTFSGASPSTCLFSYHNYRKPITSDWLTLTISTPTNNIKLQQLFFKRSPTWTFKSWLHKILQRFFSQVKMQFSAMTRRSD
jgi:hypothetical protein